VCSRSDHGAPAASTEPDTDPLLTWDTAHCSKTGPSVPPPRSRPIEIALMTPDQWANPAAERRVTGAWIHRPGGLEVSDHAPVVLDLEE